MIKLEIEHLGFERKKIDGKTFHISDLQEQVTKQIELWQEYAKALEEYAKLDRQHPWNMNYKNDKVWLFSVISLQLKIEALQTAIRENAKLAVESGITLMLDKEITIK